MNYSKSLLTQSVSITLLELYCWVCVPLITRSPAVAELADRTLSGIAAWSVRRGHFWGGSL